MTDDPTLRIDEDAVLGLVTAIVDLEYLGRRRDREIHAPGRMLETVQSHLQSTRAKDLRVELRDNDWLSMDGGVRESRPSCRILINTPVTELLDDAATRPVLHIASQGAPATS